MAITTLLDPALLPARTMDQDAFNAAMAYLMTNLPTWGAQTNAVQANLNSIAAGGAYALPYTFDGTSATAGDPGAGKLRLNVIAGQSTSTAMYISTTDALGAAIALTLATFDDSTSVVKGVIKLYKQGDASKWLRFSVTAVTAGAYYTITLVPINGSASNPFVNGDALLLDFQRTGDKGDQGVAGNSSNLILVGSYTVSTAVAAINFLSLFTSTYDKYIIEIQGMTASAAATLRMRMAQAGVSQAVAAYAHQYSTSSGMSTNNSSFQLTPANVASTANLALSCSIEVRNVNAASPSSITANGGVFTDTSGSCYPMDTYGLYSGTAACSGFTLFMSTGNISAGIVRVFGVKNT